MSKITIHTGNVQVADLAMLAIIAETTTDQNEAMTHLAYVVGVDKAIEMRKMAYEARAKITLFYVNSE